MTREIRFRGFHKDENGKETIYLNEEEIKGGWVYGSLVYDVNKKWYIHRNNCALCIGFHEVIPETVGQYTGLNDSNRKRIFENDVVKYTNEKTSYIVMFDPTGYWCLDGNGARNSEMLIQLDDTNKYIEVIGTIFDKEVK